MIKLLRIRDANSRELSQGLMVLLLVGLVRLYRWHVREAGPGLYSIWLCAWLIV